MIKLIFDDVNKLAKFKSCKLYISEFTLFVKVSIDNLNEASNPVLSRIRKLERINKLKKNDIKIKKIDISSIFPIIIKMIKLIFDDVNKLAKFKFCKLYISEFTVFVNARIDNLKDFSNPM